MVSFPEPRRSHPYHMHDMIRGQPSFVSETLERMEQVDVDALLGRARPLILTGCGTSFYAALYGARVLGEAMEGRRSVEALHAYDLLFSTRTALAEATVLGVSHSGQTPTTNRALTYARRHGARIIAVCSLPGSPMERIADQTVVIGSTHDRSWANTMSYTTQLTAFARIASEAGGTLAGELTDALEELPRALAKAQACEESIRRLAKAITARERVTYLGSGLDEITAHEAALKIRETCSLPASSYHLEQFLHGPFLSLDRTEAIVALRSREDGKRAGAILDALAHTGALVAQVGDGAGADIPLPAAPHRILRPLLSVIPMQYLAYYAALERGTNPDVMRTDVRRYHSGVDLLFAWAPRPRKPKRV